MENRKLVLATSQLRGQYKAVEEAMEGFCFANGGGGGITPESLTVAVEDAENKIQEPQKRPTIKEFLQKNRITKYTIIPPLEITAWITQLGKDYPIATKGDLTFISGKAKAGKSTVLTALIASVIAQNKELDFFSISSKSRKIVYFDTEQSIQTLGVFRKKICQYAELEELPDEVIILQCLDVEKKERLNLIKEIILSDEVSDCDIWIIDGLSDLPDDDMESKESTLIIDELRQLASKANTSIILSAHENPSQENSKIRGHLGTKAEQKAGTIFRVKKDKQTKTHAISPHLSRHCGDFEEILFAWSESKGRMVSLEGEEKEKATITIEANKAKKSKHTQEICNYFILNGFGEIQKSKLIEFVANKFEVGKSTAEKYVNDYEEWGIIIRHEINSRKILYSFNHSILGESNKDNSLENANSYAV